MSQNPFTRLGWHPAHTPETEATGHEIPPRPYGDQTANRLDPPSAATPGDRVPAADPAGPSTGAPTPGWTTWDLLNVSPASSAGGQPAIGTGGQVNGAQSPAGVSAQAAQWGADQGSVVGEGGGSGFPLPRLSAVVMPANWQQFDTAADVVSVPVARAPQMDWGLVNALKKDSVSLEEEQGRSNLTTDQQRAQALDFITQVVNRQVEADLRDGVEWRDDDEARYIQAVFDSRFGLGRIHPLLQIPDAEDVVVVGTNDVLVTHADGHQTRLPPVAEDDADLTEQITHIAQNTNPPRAFDAMHTDVTIMHEGRFRIHAISGEIALHPSIVIRQHLLRRISLADLAARRLMPIEVAHLLDCAVQANLSIAVAGEQGAGKTTLLRALIDAIPARDRFATLETDQELFAHELPGRETSLTLFARDGMGERNPDGSFAGAVTVAQMVPPALRQGLTRLILGELRLGYEATAMFEAMQAGAGTLCSVHSPSPELVASRLADMVSQSGSYSIESAMRQIALSIKLIVYVRRRDTAQGRRRFIEAITLSKLGDDGFSLAPEIIYQADTWTGETLQYTPGDLAQGLAQFQRPLQRYEQDPR